jgi:hypothetical protein
MSVNCWLYLIQRGDHRKQHKKIYKIGGINDFNHRINECPPYSQITAVNPIEDDRKCEENLYENLKMILNLEMI